MQLIICAFFLHIVDKYIIYFRNSNAGTVYTSGAPGFIPGFSGVRVARSLVFCAVFCRSLFVPFLLAILLCVLVRFTASDYPFGTLQLFLGKIKMNTPLTVFQSYSNFRYLHLYLITWLIIKRLIELMLSDRQI